MRRGPLLVLGLIALGAGLAVLAALLRARTGPRSVVLVTIDTLRADFTGVGGRTPSPTPQLDVLARRGVVFTDAWTTAPLTVPAHATLLTGVLPPQHGLRTNEPAHLLAPAAPRGWPTVAEHLRAAGLRTGAFVSASVLRREQTGLDAGFDVYDEVPPAKPGSLVMSERPGEETVDRALAWVGDDERPFFLWVHLFDPHGPYDAPVGWGAGKAHVTDAQGYEGEVRYADHCLGRLLAAIDGRDAVVVVVADHGESLGEHGEATHGLLLNEATLRVPLVVVADGVTAPGTRVTEPRSTADVAATLVALAGTDLPADMPGEPLVGTRKPRGSPRVLYAETLYGNATYGWAQAFALRIGTWKLVDAGSELRETDLATDPGEDAVALLDRAAPADRAGRPLPLADALATLREFASLPIAAAGTAAAPVDGGGYMHAGRPAETVLSPEANARLPSPYARIADHALVETAAALIARGAADAALAQLDQVARRDPANFQVPYWEGRALQAAGRQADAADAFRRALDLGMHSSRCVEKGLQASVLAAATAASPGERDAESRRAVRFLERAREIGVPDSAMTAVLECHVLRLLGDRERAREALDRARTFPPTPETDERIRRTQQDLDSGE